MGKYDKEAVLSTALSYLSAGIVPVCVTHPTDSHPAAGKAPRATGWQRIAPSPVQVTAWFSRPSNLGILCGKRSGLVCIDIDARNGGMRWLYENEEKLGRNRLCENTGSGGFHLYYRYPSGVDYVPSLTGQDGLAPGVELKADGGHQVVTWPSVHPSGGTYFFEHGGDLLDLEREADELPAWILEAAVARKAKPAEVSTVQAPGLSDCPQELERALEALRHHGPAVEGQGGDNHTFRAACIGGNYGITAKLWWPHLLAWNETCQPPWEPKDLAVKMKSAIRSGAKDFGKWTAAADFPEEVEEAAILEVKEATQQLQELGVDKYPHNNPVLSVRKFLSSLGGYFYADKIDHLYENDTWNITTDDRLKSDIWKAIVEKNPDVNLKDKHTVEIYKAMHRKDYCKDYTYDTWRDGRTGDFVRVMNGIVDLNRVELLPHSKDWISCTKLPFSFDPSARCPVFEGFLQSIWRRMPDHIEMLQRWLGYLLSSRTDLQKFVFLHGESRGGKGTLIKLMAALVGDNNYMAAEVNTFGSRFGLSEAIGKKLILIPDAHKGGREASDYASERLKLITGEDPVVVERKNINQQTIRLKCKIVMAANDIPRLIDIRGSIFNRMLLFDFIESFAGKEDPTLEARLMKELPGIFNWAIHGLEKLNADGKLSSPESSMETLAGFKKTANPLDDFFDEHIEHVAYEEGKSPEILYLNDAYNQYLDDCKNSSRHAVGKNKFASCLLFYFAKFPDVKKDQSSRGQNNGPRLTYYSNLRLRYSLRNYIASQDFSDADDDLI